MPAGSDLERLDEALAAFLVAWYEEPDPLYRAALGAACEVLEDALVEATAARARARREGPEHPAQPPVDPSEAAVTGEGRRRGSRAGAGPRDQGGHVRLIGGCS